MKKTYIKTKINPTSSLEKLIDDLLRTNFYFFPQYKLQFGYLAEFLKYGDEENVFHKWFKSDFNYNHTQDSIHNS